MNATKMNDTSKALAQRLIRNFNDVPTEREVRAPLCDSLCARLAGGTAACKLGISRLGKVFGERCA